MKETEKLLKIIRGKNSPKKVGPEVAPEEVSIKSKKLPKDIKDFVGVQLSLLRDNFEYCTNKGYTERAEQINDEIKLLEANPVEYFVKKKEEAQEKLNDIIKFPKDIIRQNEQHKRSTIYRLEEVTHLQKIINALQDNKSIGDSSKKESGLLKKFFNNKDKKNLEQTRVTPETEEVAKIEEETKNLSPEEKEKIKFGLDTFGFKAEKAKNDFFASIFNAAINGYEIKGHKFAGIGEKGRGKFYKKLRNRFIQQSKDAVTKANDASAFSDTKLGIPIKGQKRGINISAEKQRTMSNWGNFSGNVLKYGRLISDAVGITVGAANRVAMAVGMATVVLAEAGKETYLENEKVIERTRIHDADIAAEEAWKIYEKAGGTFEDNNKGNRTWNTNGLSTEDLKNKYLMEMPKDLQERLKDPSTANTFIQKILRKELLGYEIKGHVIFEGAISRLNKNIEKLELNNKLTDEEKKTEIEKLITKQKKNLEDYDRIVTQYGTVDFAAMLLRYSQTAGKATVAILQVETLVIGIDKICETASHLYHNFHDANTVLPPVSPVSAVAPKSIPETSSAINFENKGIKFENGKGGVEGILDLKKQIAEQYGGNYDKTPKGIQEFMKTDAVEKAIKLGLFDPNNPNGKESARIMAGAILKFDKDGNLLFGTPDASGNIPTLKKFNGEMFDSDHNTNHGAEVAEKPTTPEQTIPTEPEKVEPVKNEIPTDTKIHITEPNQVQIEKEYKIREDLINAYKIENTNLIDNTRTPHLGYQTAHMGETTIQVGLPRHYAPDYNRMGHHFEASHDHHPGSKLHHNNTGHHPNHHGSHNNSAIYNYNIGGNYGERYIFNGKEYFLDKETGRYHDAYGIKEHFPGLTESENTTLQNSKFAKNLFNLSGPELLETYNKSLEDMSHLFKNDNERAIWYKLSTQKANEVLEYTNETNIDATTKRFSDYLNLLKKFSGLEPKKGLLGIGAEDSEDYMYRALQKLTKDESGKEFKKSLDSITK
ncbi:MAG: hypothetical protein WCW93_03475 [Candidatus Paceibacterota bacterium]